MDTTRVIIASIVGIVLLLILLVKYKLNPFISLLISALFIGLGAGLDVDTLIYTVEEGAGSTLQGVVLLIGLGSLFGGVLQESGGATSLAQTLIDKFGEQKASIALGITGLVVGITVYFEAGVMILMPLAFSLASKTGKSTLYYAIPLLAGLASSFAFIPPSAGSMLVANILNVDLGLMIIVGVPTAIISLFLAGVVFSKYIGKRINVYPLNTNNNYENNLPSFKIVLFVILLPLSLILLNTLCSYIELPDFISSVIELIGTPFVALIIAILAAIYLLCKKQNYDNIKIKSILDTSLKPTAAILLVICGGGVISEVLQACGVATLVSNIMQNSNLPIILIAFLIAGMIRICIGAAVVSMTMTATLLIAIPEIAALDQLYLAAIVLAINGGATAFSHFNDSGFWLVSSMLEINEKNTLQTWTVMETIIGLTGLMCSIVIVLFI